MCHEPPIGSSTFKTGPLSCHASGTERDFDRDFGLNNGRIKGLWDGFILDVSDCAGRIVGLSTRAGRNVEDFEMRVAKRCISRAPTTQRFGVDGRRVPMDIDMRFLGVMELGTKTEADTMQFLDGLAKRAYVRVERGWQRLMVVGDQETFALVHKIIKKQPQRYVWIVPWIGDWHLMEHTLDVIFRKWAGFGIMKLAMVGHCWKSYHKRHFVLVSVLEALWMACADEVQGTETDVDDGSTSPSSRLLRKLHLYVGNATHKTFRQWVDLLLRDGKAYLALYTGMRVVGEFELREVALRQIAPLFLGYGKTLYHDLCIQHLADIAAMTAEERSFASDVFSLSLVGHEGKNVGLEEIQEMTFNKDLKTTASSTEVNYLEKTALTHFR